MNDLLQLETPDVRLVSSLNPFSNRVMEMVLPEGGTVKDMVLATGLDPVLLSWCHVCIDGYPIPQSSWNEFRPPAKSQLTIKVIPQGGEGGKDVLRMVAMIAVIIVATIVSYGWAGPALAGVVGATGKVAAGITAATAATLSAAGMYAVNALIPPPMPQAAVSTGGSPTYSISGMRNQMVPYGVVPKLFGTHRFYPFYAARPYTEIVGNDQFLRCLFTAGKGPYSVSDWKIGETPLENFEDVEYEFIAGWPGDGLPSLFSNDIQEEQLSIELDNPTGDAWYTDSLWETHHDGQNPGEVVERVTATDIDEFTLDITMPAGIGYWENNGDRHTWTVEIEVKYAPVGSSEWVYASNSPITISGFSPSLIRKGLRQKVSAGQYRIRVRKLASYRDYPFNSGPTWVGVQQATHWTTLRSIRYTAPVTLPGLCLMALRIKATDQLTGIIDELNGVFTPILPVWEQTPAALTLNGSDQYGGAGQVITGTLQELTLEARVRIEDFNQPTGEASNSPIITNAELVGGVVNGFCLRAYHTAANNTYWSVLIGDGISDDELIFDTLTDAAFATKYADEHLRLKVVFKKSEYIKLYIGGIEVASASTTQVRSGVPNQALRIGRIANSLGSGYLHADYVSDVRVWNTVTLPHDEDRGIYGNESGLIVYWPLNEGSGDLGRDVTGNGYDLTLCNSPTWRTSNLPSHYGWTRKETRLAAWAYAEIMLGSSNRRPLQDTRINRANLLEWAEADEAAGRYFDAVFDDSGNVFRRLCVIAAAGRAAWDMPEGKYGVVRDIPQTVPRQHITPANSSGWCTKKTFLTIPHALRIQFINAENGWQRDERIVFDDGYKSSNATIYETLDWVGSGITDRNRVWKEGRFHFACLKLRPEVHSTNMDYEHIVVTRGDMVRAAHDVIAVSLSSGRVTDLDLGSDGTCIGVVVDNECPMEEEKEYNVRFRLSNGSSLLKDVEMHSGAQTLLVFVESIPPDTSSSGSAEYSRPEVGDIFMFGESGSESGEYTVKSIEGNGPDLGVTLVLVDHAPAVHTADQGTIPEFDSNITIPPELNRGAPPKPIIVNVRSDEYALIRAADGSLHSRIVVSLGWQSTGKLPASHIEAQYKRSNTGHPWISKFELASVTEISINDVEDGIAYNVRLRSISKFGVASEWTRISDYVVIGKTNAPPDIEDLWVEGTILKWNYPVKPPDFRGFDVRYRSGSSANWEGAAQIQKGIITASQWDYTELPAGEYMIMVRALDTSNNLSAITSISLIISSPTLRNLIYEDDHYVLGWPGVQTDCSEDSATGKLMSDGDPDDLFFGPPAEPFFGAPTDPFFDTDWLTMQYIASITPEAADCPSRLLVSVTIDQGGPWTLDYRVDEEPSSSGGMNEWRSWPGSLEVEYGKSYDIRLTIVGGPTRPILTQMEVRLDVPDIIEYLDDILIEAGGTRLPITETYRAIKNVQLTLIEESSQTAERHAVQDKNASLGPMVVCYGESGGSVEGTVDARVLGY